MIENLLESGSAVAFFRAVERLESAAPGCTPVGGLGPTGKEAIRFRPNASLGFPLSDVQSIEAQSDDDEALPRFLMTVNFLGLYGPSTPLPVFYTEVMLAADRDDTARRDFLDLFHHRLISLFYRCWKKYRYYLTYDKVVEDRFSQSLFSLIGLRDSRVRGTTGLNWTRLLSFTGLLGMRSHSASVVARIVSRYFDGLPVAIRQFVERWATIDPSQRVALGSSNCRLGQDLSLGARVRDRAGKFRLTLGPSDFATFSDHLPTGIHYSTLRELVRFVVSDQIEFDVELSLKTEQVPELRLEVNSPCRLGWSSVLGHHPLDRNMSVVFPA